MDEKMTVSEMLAEVLDSHYGLSFHHIGDGDGIQPNKAKQIAEWWQKRTSRPGIRWAADSNTSPRRAK